MHSPPSIRFRRRQRQRDSTWYALLLLYAARVSINQAYVTTQSRKYVTPPLRASVLEDTSSTSPSFNKTSSERHSIISDTPHNPTTPYHVNGARQPARFNNMTGQGGNHGTSSSSSSALPTTTTSTDPSRRSGFVQLTDVETRIKARVAAQKNEHKSYNAGQQQRQPLSPPPTPPPLLPRRPHTTTTLHALWRRRHARSAEEGIRRETTVERSIRMRKATQLGNLLAKASSLETSQGRRVAARTITGLLNALAEEVADLDVQVAARPDTPLWNKQVDALRISFSRLGFKPLKLGGLDYAMGPSSSSSSSSVISTSSGAAAATTNSTTGNIFGLLDNVAIAESPAGNPEQWQQHYHHHQQQQQQQHTVSERKALLDLSSPDEAFDKIDTDKSGTLDRDEIALALSMAAASSSSADDGGEGPSQRSMAAMQELAADLLKLYDFNGDGVVDRTEYQSMIEDMAALREAADEKAQGDHVNVDDSSNGEGWFARSKNFVFGLFSRQSSDDDDTTENETEDDDDNDQVAERVSQELATSRQQNKDRADDAVIEQLDEDGVIEITKAMGSITLTGLKLDLRRLVFGAVPILKHITPGGPLILEPFKASVAGSFNRADIKNSKLIDAGLRRLVALALRRRVRGFRDFIDAAVFYGRSWKDASTTAPLVEVPELTDIEFDENNKLVLTGRARVRTRSDSPQIENVFKLRTKIGTRKDGRTIRLVEPELAFVLECPKGLETAARTVCQALTTKPLERPKPIYQFFPIYSPFKLDDNDGFDLGEDNCIKSIFIEDGALRFEISAVLRPGRFLGNHYIAFTIPNRTFILTLDRMKEGMKSARKVKQEAMAKAKAEARARSLSESSQLVSDDRPIDVDYAAAAAASGLPESVYVATSRKKQPKSFFSRFVDGYLQAERDDEQGQRATTAIRDFFGRQSTAVVSLNKRRRKRGSV